MRRNARSLQGSAGIPCRQVRMDAVKAGSRPVVRVPFAPATQADINVRIGQATREPLSMSRFLRLLSIVALFASPSAFAEAGDRDSLYSLGALMAQQLEELQLSEDELDEVFEGFRDQVRGDGLRLETDAHMDELNRFIAQRRAGAAQLAEGEQRAYIDDFVEEGGTRTESGLAYRIIDEGSGDPPAASDTVEVHYEGSLIDGEVFDSSRERGETATFPLNRVIPGWTEGLQLIAPGGRIELVIPSELAYGDQGSPPTIPGGATLIFEVELIDVQ